MTKEESLSDVKKRQRLTDDAWWNGTGIDEVTQDDVLESFEHYLTHKRKLERGIEWILRYIKDYQAYMKEIREEELAGANIGFSDSDWETDR